jgi:hypothetical protein
MRVQASAVQAAAAHLLLDAFTTGPTACRRLCSTARAAKVEEVPRSKEGWLCQGTTFRWDRLNPSPGSTPVTTSTVIEARPKAGKAR